MTTREQIAMMREAVRIHDQITDTIRNLAEAVNRYADWPYGSEPYCAAMYKLEGMRMALEAYGVDVQWRFLSYGTGNKLAWVNIGNENIFSEKSSNTY